MRRYRQRADDLLEHLERYCSVRLRAMVMPNGMRPDIEARAALDGVWCRDRDIVLRRLSRRELVDSRPQPLRAAPFECLGAREAPE